MQILSATTELLVAQIFPISEQAIVCELLKNDCGNNLPFLSTADEIVLERFRFAALKLSEGNLDKLRRACEVAKVDWRDLLVAAGFGHEVKAHEKWAQSILNP